MSSSNLSSVHLSRIPPFHTKLTILAHITHAPHRRGTYKQSKPLVEVYRLFATPFVDIEEEDNHITNSIPLVVSTMGWTKGLGIDLARRLEEFVQPSDIFSFDISPSDSRSESGGPRLHILEPFRQLSNSPHPITEHSPSFHIPMPSSLNPSIPPRTSR